LTKGRRAKNTSLPRRKKTGVNSGLSNRDVYAFARALDVGDEGQKHEFKSVLSFNLQNTH
jgi:hypothetical protein